MLIAAIAVGGINMLSWYQTRQHIAEYCRKEFDLAGQVCLCISPTVKQYGRLTRLLT